MAFEELKIHTMRDAAMCLIDILNLFLSQPIPVNDETISVFEEYMKNTKIENIREAYLKIDAVDSEVCCSDKKALKNYDDLSEE